MNYRSNPLPTPQAYAAIIMSIAERSLPDRPARWPLLLASEAIPGTDRFGHGAGRETRVRLLGQGAKWRGAGRLLFERDPVFRAVLEQCEACFKPLAGWSLLAQILGDDPAEGAAEGLTETEVARPVTLALQVALAALWRSWSCARRHRRPQPRGDRRGPPCRSHRGSRRVPDRLPSRPPDAAGGWPELPQPPSALPPTTPSARRRRFGRPASLVALNGPEFTTVSGNPDAVRELVDRLKSPNTFARILDVELCLPQPQMDPLLGNSPPRWPVSSSSPRQPRSSRRSPGSHQRRVA